MTEENRRQSIADEVARAIEAYRSAMILLDAGQLADSVSRAYYACFHHARALLLMTGQEARCHRDVEGLLRREAVRGGKLDPDAASTFARLLEARQDADYAAGHVFTAAFAARALRSARAFCERAREVLIRDGWLPAAAAGSEHC